MCSNFVKHIAPDLQLEVEFVSDLCETIDTPRSLAVYLMVKYGEWEEYLSLSCDQSHYTCPSNFADDWLVTEVLRKSPNLPLSINRVDQALETFWDSELGCAYANDRIGSESFMYERELGKWISRVLGPLDSIALGEIDRRMRHGPGATATLRGSGMIPSDKYGKSLSMTVALYPFYRSIVGENWATIQNKPMQVVYGNKFTTVPKSAKTDRGICSEPTLNMYVQLGIGSYIRSRLALFGVDLNDQTRNQRLAQRAHKDGLATIDLSSASDSLARNVILHYFPEPWTELLSLARSHRCFIEGQWHELEKFSSMGNGYTFELESLLFFSVIRCIVPRERMNDVGVYGDDLIVPAEYANIVIDALKFLGFRVNKSKTFLAGSFFESCGTDWFKGQNVRPFYLKGSKENIPYTIQICNKLRRYAFACTNQLGSDPRFRPLWEKYARKVPKFWRKLHVPLSYGDTGLIVDETEFKLSQSGSFRPRDQIEGFVVRHAVMVPSFRVQRSLSHLLTLLPRGALNRNADIDVTINNPIDTIFESLQIATLPSLRGSHYSGMSKLHQSSDTPATYGKETVRGYLARVRTRQSILNRWTDGLEWA